MKSLALYLCALSLHLILLSVVFQFQIHKRQPVLALLLLESLGANVALLLLARAGERAAYAQANARFHFVWYALVLGAIGWSLAHWDDAASKTVCRGLVVLLVMTLVARHAVGVGFLGGMGARVASAANAAYLAPTVYLIFALSNVGIDRMPLWIGAPRSLAALRMTAEAAAGYARTMLS